MRHALRRVRCRIRGHGPFESGRWLGPIGDARCVRCDARVAFDYQYLTYLDWDDDFESAFRAAGL